MERRKVSNSTSNFQNRRTFERSIVCNFTRRSARYAYWNMRAEHEGRLQESRFRIRRGIPRMVAGFGRTMSAEQCPVEGCNGFYELERLASHLLYASKT